MDTESNLLVLEVLFLALFNEGAHAFLLVGGGEAHGKQLVFQSNDATELNRVNEAGIEASREMAKNFLADSGLAVLV
mgnify:CR=1 FL=1